MATGLPVALFMLVDTEITAAGQEYAEILLCRKGKYPPGGLT